MNVLLISFSFPPAGGVGVLRALSLAKYLPESDIRVDVLTARNAPSVGRDESLLQQLPRGVTVHGSWTPDLPFAWRKAIKRFLSRGRHADTSAPRPSASRAEPSHLRAFVANLLLPDPQVGWVPFAARRARRIIRSRSIDAVVITVPPFSSVMLASRLRKVFPSLPIVLDFRDEWLTTTIGLVSFNKNSKARAVASRTEAEAVAAATVIVAVTDAARDEIAGRYPRERPEKFVCIPNGFDGPLPTSVLPPNGRGDRLILTYMGTVYGSTDPRSFAEAIDLLPPPLRSRLHIRFIGHIETAEHRQMLQSRNDVVELVGFLPQAAALEQLRTSDYMLLITHDPINVSAKFYDYLGAGRPVLAAIHPNGDVRRILERTRAGAWADVDDPRAIAGMLATALRQAEKSDDRDYRPDLEVVHSYHRRPLAKRYADLLHGLHEAPR